MMSLDSQFYEFFYNQALLLIEKLLEKYEILSIISMVLAVLI